MKSEERRMGNQRIRYGTAALFFVLSISLYGETSENILDGFDDSIESTSTTSETLKKEESSASELDGFDDNNSSEIVENDLPSPSGFSGKIVQQVAYSYEGSEPHNNLTSLNSSLFLDYEKKFENGIKIKTNAKVYHNFIYDARDENYKRGELSAFRSEVELFDAYVEGSLADNIDIKIGRQVVVWGRSDTIRITDILNPLDNRRPGMVDIEDLRLPVTMAKLDYFIGDWRVAPIAILEQRFNKNPPYGSEFFPFPSPAPDEKSYYGSTFGLSVGGEFSGWDVNFYAARTRQEDGHVVLSASGATIDHDKVNMLGSALNYLTGSWLIKSELAYFDGLKYTSTQNETFTRVDGLVGLEYKGIADTMFSYDFSVRHFNAYDGRLLNELSAFEENNYQHAFRVTSDFLNATLHGNYLISLYGSKMNEGGFQRAWIKYDIADALSTNIGVVDYIGGSKMFDSIKDNDMLFVDVTYSF